MLRNVHPQLDLNMFQNIANQICLTTIHHSLFVHINKLKGCICGSPSAYALAAPCVANAALHHVVI